MSVRNLEYLFKPKSVAVIGASNRERSVGSVAMRNLLTGGFTGPIMPVNPKNEAIHGVYAYRDVDSLPVTPDMAVIATPPATVPGIIRQLGERGTKAAVVITAGLSDRMPDGEQTYAQAMLDAAHPHALRILGSNCLGMIVPGIGLNASFSHAHALPGRIAFVSQSGGLTTAVLDYALSYDIGFSHFLSLGDSDDVDFGDVLDYLGGDPEVSAILLYIEAIDAAREFMSAARAAARNKPVLAIKAGRVAEGARAAASHTGALAGSDIVYDAALRRAGILRVFAIDELFDAVQTLARAKPLKGDRLAILTNGGGPGVLATDALIDGGGKLAEVSPDTIAKLNEELPPTWSKANPVDIIGDAPGGRYRTALAALLEDPEIDGVLAMHVPVATASATDAAEAVVDAAKTHSKPVLTNWLGADNVRPARDILSAAGLPTYFTPERAVRGFLHLVNYNRNQELLTQTPPSLAADIGLNREGRAALHGLFEQVLADGRDMLTEPEAKRVLAAYGVPVVQTRETTTPEQAAQVAAEIGFPVAVKILSTDISHKSDVGGVVLNLENAEEVHHACESMLARVGRRCPDARLEGFSVQQMATRPGAHELIIGVTTDAVFGPVILFGQGGTAVEVVGDRAVALPPLNAVLARAQIDRTRVIRLLRGYRDRPAADLDAIALTLIRISQLVIDLPEIIELDINPLWADEHGVLALDARIRVRPRAEVPHPRLAIRPYPKEQEELVEIAGGQQVLLRPIRPEDEPAHAEFISRLSPEDIRFRFFGLVREFPHSQMARFTQIDYDREMAFIATRPEPDAPPETLGVVRAIADPDNDAAEFAIVVRSDLKHQGMGQALMDKMITYAKARGTGMLVGQVLRDNYAMRGLAQAVGFDEKPIEDGDVFEVTLKLNEKAEADGAGQPGSVPQTAKPSLR